jgi:hypothetical protein
MTDAKLALALLVSLYDFARADLVADLDTLAGRLAVRRERVETALAHLEERRLADADRIRLTLTGLAVAVGLRAESVAQAPLAA